MGRIKVVWNYISWNEGFTWGKNILPQLQRYNVKEDDLNRAVYVIRTNGLFAIRYDKGISPTLYIGEGNFKSRLTSHKKWLNNLTELIKDFNFQIAFCIPRLKNYPNLYKDMEAALINEFQEEFNALPLINSQNEYAKKDHEYYPLKDFRKPLLIGQGRRFYWAISPMRCNENYQCFQKN